MSDPCYPPNNSSQNPYNPYMVAAATLGVAKVVHDVTGHSIGPMTGYQYTQAGTENMDEAMTLLRQRKEGSREYIISAEARQNLLRQHQELQPEMFRLQEETRTYGGSVRNWNKGRKFHTRSVGFQYDTKKSSDTELAAYEQAQAQAEIASRYNADRDDMATSRSSHGSSRRHRGNQEDDSEEEVTEESQSEHPWDDGRSSLSGGSASQTSYQLHGQHPPPHYGATGQSQRRPHRSQHYPQGAQPPHYMHSNPPPSVYPQEGSSSEYSAYAAFNGGFPANGYPPTRPY